MSEHARTVRHGSFSFREGNSPGPTKLSGYINVQNTYKWPFHCKKTVLEVHISRMVIHLMFVPSTLAIYVIKQYTLTTEQKDFHTDSSLLVADTIRCGLKRPKPTGLMDSRIDPSVLWHCTLVYSLCAV